jgi:hypothetical protein
MPRCCWVHAGSTPSLHNLCLSVSAPLQVACACVYTPAQLLGLPSTRCSEYPSLLLSMSFPPGHNCCACPVLYRARSCLQIAPGC